MGSYTITAEEKALLDAAKQVCRHFGFANGELITAKGRRSEAEEALISQLRCGAVVVEGRFVADIEQSR